MAPATTIAGHVMVAFELLSTVVVVAMTESVTWTRPHHHPLERKKKKTTKSAAAAAVVD